METSKIKREIVAVFMESPLYFSIPLKRGLEFIMFFSQQPVYDHIGELNKDRRAESEAHPAFKIIPFPYLSNAMICCLFKIINTRSANFVQEFPATF